MTKHLTLALLALTGLGACSPAKPASPTYTEDIRPILVAHCTRCHGAGGMLLGDSTTTLQLYKGPPTQGYFESYLDQGDCSQPDGGPPPTSPTCQRGASWEVSVNTIAWKTYLFDTKVMPPAPAAPLNDWERDMLLRWTQNPLCGSGSLCGDDAGVD